MAHNLVINGVTYPAVKKLEMTTDAGKKVLLCDFDPQANATSGLGLDKRHLRHSVYDVVINGTPVTEAIVATQFGHVLPSAADLAGAAVELITMERPNEQLKDALDKVVDGLVAVSEGRMPEGVDPSMFNK